ncbi:MAG: hypothetical protein ACI8WT_003997 [Clostridium sp.]|jgi:hypothetical protein
MRPFTIIYYYLAKSDATLIVAPLAKEVVVQPTIVAKFVEVASVAPAHIAELAAEAPMAVPKAVVPVAIIGPTTGIVATTAVVVTIAVVDAKAAIKGIRKTITVSPFSREIFK